MARACFPNVSQFPIWETLFPVSGFCFTGKNNGFPILDILGYLKNTHKNPKFGRVRQIPIREFPTRFPNWDLSRAVPKLLQFSQKVAPIFQKSCSKVAPKF